MWGTAINCAAIMVGACLGLARDWRLGARRQSQIKVGLGVATALIGIRGICLSLSGVGIAGAGRGFVVMMAALMAGKVLGRMLCLQQLSNRLGRFARQEMARIESGAATSPSVAMRVCAGLYCAAPLAFLGPLQEGLERNLFPVLAKSALDGMAAFAFVDIFGWGVVLAVAPVAALQGSLWMAAAAAEPYLRSRGLVEPVGAVCGFLLFCVSLIILEVRKVEIADYLPALVIAPVLAAYWR
jgi:uncharacterized membrane protein YqgA involved in biofilm formation